MKKSRKFRLRSEMKVLRSAPMRGSGSKGAVEADDAMWRPYRLTEVERGALELIELIEVIELIELNERDERRELERWSREPERRACEPSH